MTKLNLERNNIRILFIGYIVIALLGTFILMLPIMHTQPITFLDAFFTSASAVSMTGLIVLNTSLDFSFYGQIVILILIQIGGLGYMSIAMALYILVRKKMSFGEKNLLRESLIYPQPNGLVDFLKKVLIFVFTIELLGAMLLFLRFKLDMSLSKALWASVFHSISAFNNAGFSIFETGLVPYRDDFWINFIITSLIIIGGLGYFVLLELYFFSKKRFANLSLHTKLVLSSSVILIIFASLVVFLFEYHNPKSIGELSLFDKIMSAYFTAVNYRTAGFNTLDFSTFKDASLFFGSLFMIIGGAPGGTAGGIKVTTIAILLIYAYWSIKDGVVRVFNFEIPSKTINKAFVITVSSIVYIITCVLILSFIEDDKHFLHLLFETSSAFATVGVSVGDSGTLSLSANFNPFSKLIIILLMLSGRVGVLAFLFSIFFKEKEKYLNYPKGKIIL
ncbi:potassium transporter [Campylobacter sp. P255]|uniref:TrkH family potassium uptake protein n=1 Tax=Campylobacter sp. P255 TaxID=1979368 RepID=UPI000EA96E10|nr:TrkH family potassium uptake protein [Campylobacter sp. P255]RKO64333.1 potassium transporter [Campylobacter sp. P255]